MALPNTTTRCQRAIHFGGKAFSVRVVLSVPVHKVDDISHVNYTDRDHLWFDPNWKSDTSDPVAAMLDNLASGNTGSSSSKGNNNNNSSHIFVNNLGPEYAEVDGLKGIPGSDGPYATTTLVEPPPYNNGSSGSSSVRKSLG